MNTPTSLFLLSVFLTLPLAAQIEPECKCPKNLDESSGAEGDGRFPPVAAKKEVGYDPEEVTADFTITGGDSGGACHIDETCTNTEDPCNWTYEINVEVTHDPGKDQVVKVRHGGVEYTLDPYGCRTIETQEKSLACDVPWVPRVKSLDENGAVMSKVTLPTLECIDCNAR